MINKIKNKIKYFKKIKEIKYYKNEIKKIPQAIIFISIILISILSSSIYYNYKMSSNEHLKLMGDMQKKKLLENGDYRCCITKTCSYCLINEGSCDCLDEIVDGKSPCPECIGEIIEGEGNIYLKEYFEDALVYQMGEESRETIRKIISEKY